MEWVADIRTVAVALTHEIDKISGSRFIADVIPATSEAAALQSLAAVREREPSATHHCWALRLQDGRRRDSDDGEPSGTAGAPIQRHIGGSGLVDLIVVVTRYYGGTKLGTGGLVRAYGGATSAALGLVEVAVRPVLARLAVDHDYELSGAVQAVMAAHDAQQVDADYGASVQAVVTLPVEGAPAFVAAMTEATSGRVTPVRAPPPPDAVPDM
ncbi:YigZ family protein [soil metagenome]